eukprot:scaffold139931_cov20-Tisochrysis_lutea.AAC.1
MAILLRHQHLDQERDIETHTHLSAPLSKCESGITLFDQCTWCLHVSQTRWSVPVNLCVCICVWAHTSHHLRFGLESALLSALASAYGTSLPDLLQLSSSSSNGNSMKSPTVSDGRKTAGQQQQQQQQHASGMVRINGLLSPRGDRAEAVAAAQALVSAGHTCIKVKVARR